MTVKQTLRITLDCSMTIMLICAYAYRITGDTAHEWLGVSVISLFIAHIIINRKWWTRIKSHSAEGSPPHKTIFKDLYTARHIIMTAVNIALALITITLVITGLLQSRAVLAFLHLPGGMALRLIHTTAAYWLIPLIGLHIGLHWNILLITFRKQENLSGGNRILKICACVLAMVIVAFGIWSSFDRDMFPKLFLGFSFDYWPSERPVVLFFAETLSIIGIYIFVIHYTPKVFVYFHKQYLRQKNRKQQA